MSLFVNSQKTSIQEKTIIYKRLIFPNIEELDDGYYDIVDRDGDTFLGYIENGSYKKGKYEFYAGGYKEGEFIGFNLENGTYHTEIMTEKGKFRNEKIHGIGKQFYPITGITIEGKFKNGNPIMKYCKFTVNPGIIVNFKNQIGQLVYTNNNFQVSFINGPIIQISGSKFKWDFDQPTFSNQCNNTVVFNDGSIYNGTPNDNDFGFGSYCINENDDFVKEKEKFTIGKNSNFIEWENYQLICWMICNNKFDHFNMDFFVLLEEDNITSEQLIKFTDLMLHNYKLNDVNILQLRIELKKMKNKKI